ncbi:MULTISPECIES: S-layer family protein [unclassified Microcoleus]|uniref:S-layer family protein n=1 Tax=unclassified Microcoleus TaxID=2642155 RepID=UPI002FD6495D
MILFAIFYLCLFPVRALGQIIPDGSLGAESSRIVPDNINNLPSDIITGGATRGSSLFHSFQEFNVGEGRGAYFTNPSGIANIFTRVTGGNPSNILGTLGVQGNANLFLLNPRGLVFGPNARLDLGGSFIGSSAAGVVFNNGFEFSAANPNAVPLLAINIPVGLRFRDNPGTIVNQSTAAVEGKPLFPPELPLSNNVGLAVAPGQTLSLIGGDIQLPGGNLTASTGQINLGSVASPGLVSFAPTELGLNLNYDNIANFGNIQISNGSVINTSGLGGGKVDIRGGNVTLNGGRIYGLTLGNIDGRGIDINAQKVRAEGGTQIFTLTLGQGTGGDVKIRATDSVEFSGIGVESYQKFVANFLTSGTANPFDPQYIIISATIGSGRAGNIRIDTPRLLIDNGAISSSAAFGAGNTGNITIRARFFEVVSSAIYNGTLRGSTGLGENILFEGERLIMRDGAVIAGVTRSDAASGNINITASESVEVLRTPTAGVVQTVISTNAIGSNGNAGEITIDTKRLIISDGAGINSANGGIIGNQLLAASGGSSGNLTIRATESVELAGISGVLANGSQNGTFLSTDTFSSGQGGNIRIETPVLTLGQGGFISTASLGAGDAGKITINARRVELIGTTNPSEFNSAIQANVGLAFGVTNPNAIGNAGSVNLNADRLVVRDGARITVANIGTGSAGNINVVANAIALDNKASIDGTTVSGTGANINLQARDIQLRGGSRITTDAGVSEGGNININSDILVALPKENSDITANARSAVGGRVKINVPNVFGFRAVTREQVRGTLGLTDAQFAALQVSPTSLLESSDIAAISQSGGPALQGAVTFSASGVNPAQGLVELPQNVVNPAALIAANPCIAGAQNEFTVTGKGGVPPSPNDTLNSAETRFPWVEAEGSSAADSVTDVTDVTDRSPREEREKKAREVVPARGWVVNGQGEVTLVGYNPGNAADSRNPRSHSVCPPR